MKRYLSFGVVIVLAIAGLGIYASRQMASTTSQRQKEPTTITKLGVILQLSGDLALLGSEVQRGIKLASAEQQGNQNEVEFIFEDDQFNPKLTVSSAQKLLQQDKVAGAITLMVNEAEPIIPIFQKEQVPLVVAWDSSSRIQEVGTFIFSNGFSIEAAGEKLAQFAYAQGERKIAVIQHQDAMENIYVPAFINNFQNLGGEIVFHETLSVDTTNYRASIQKVKNLRADAVYPALIPPTNARFFLQANELGMEPQLYTGDTLTGDIISEVGNAVEGVYYTNYFADTSDTESLRRAYTEKYEEEPVDLALVWLGYDTATKLIQSAKANPDNIQEELINIFGPDRTANRQEKIYQIKQGQPVLIPE